MKAKQFFVIVFLGVVFFSCSENTTHLDVPPEQGNILFQNVYLVDMKSDTIVKNHSVLIKKNKIAAVRASGTFNISEDTKVINGKGAYLMPGLCDMHIHTDMEWDNWPVSPLRMFLANGVTTIRCLGPRGGDQKNALRWREKINKGQLIGPAIYAGGPIFYGPVQEPEKGVETQMADGFDFIKLYSFLSKKEFQKIMIKAKKDGVYTIGHIPFRVGLDGVVSERMDEIAHIEELAWEYVHFNDQLRIKGRKWLSYVLQMAYKQYKASYAGMGIEDLDRKFRKSFSKVAQKVQMAGIPVNTTLYIDDIIVEKLFEPENFLSKPLNRYLPQNYIHTFEQKKEKHQVQFKGREDLAIFKRKLDRLILKYLNKHQILLVLGTDAGTGGMGILPGYSIHEELRILTENGYSPFEAIKTGTVNASIVIQKMKGQGNLGIIEKGNMADLILIKGNPLEDVSNIKNILGVMASGRWYDKKMLKRIVAL